MKALALALLLLPAAATATPADRPGTIVAMKDISDVDELFLDAVDHIVLEALEAIGRRQ